MATYSVTCNFCGKQRDFEIKSGRRKEYCSERCRSDARLVTLRETRPAPKLGPKIPPSHRCVCENCAASGNGRKTKGLCRDCGSLSRKIKASDAKRARNNRTELPPIMSVNGRRERAKCECFVCAKVFYPKGRDRSKCCGRECGLVWSGFKAHAKMNGCRVSVATRMNVKPPAPKEPKVYYQPITVGVCRWCGGEFDRTQDGASRFMCSEGCGAKAAAKTKRAARKKREALLRGASVGETVDPFDVFDRDGWRCKMCGVRTPRSKRGTYDDNAPELDHIMPVSRGGEHSHRNTQCLCRACNLAKSDKPWGQLVLL